MKPAQRSRCKSTAAASLGGSGTRSPASETAQARTARRTAEEKRGDTLFVPERRRSRRLPGAIRARDVRAADLQEESTKRVTEGPRLGRNRFVGSDEDGGSPANIAASEASHRMERAEQLDLTEPLFLLDDLADPLPMVGSQVQLAGNEGHHAAVVRRLRPGEMIMIGNGRGQGVRGAVLEVDGPSLTIEVINQLSAALEPQRFVAAQALAKGDRSELAIEMLTEMGVNEIVPWQASRSVVRWSPDRATRSLAKWRRTAREAAKQSRRLTVPEVSEPVSTGQLAQLVTIVDLALLLHEEAKESLAEVDLPTTGTILIIIGPEGGIAAEELRQLTEAGARPVSLSDAVLRTSTAGVVALAALKLRRESYAP